MPQKAKNPTVSADPLAAVRRWLFVVAGLIALMVVAGSAAPPSVSGLSLPDWPPSAGLLPPWGRQPLRLLIGVSFALPLGFFWLKGRITGDLRGKLLFILALGALQGFGVVGWGRAVDLLLACFTLAAILWTAEGLRPNFRDPLGRDARGFRFEAGLLLALAFAQIGFAALAAGAPAEPAANTWPLLNGRLFPPAETLFNLTPLWANFTDNLVTVQFQHRMAAGLALLIGLFHAFHISRERLARRAVRRAAALALLIVSQAALGVAVVVFAVPPPAALAHQALAIGVLALATVHRRKLG